MMFNNNPEKIEFGRKSRFYEYKANDEFHISRGGDVEYGCGNN